MIAFLHNISDTVWNSLGFLNRISGRAAAPCDRAASCNRAASCDWAALVHVGFRFEIMGEPEAPALARSAALLRPGNFNDISKFAKFNGIQGRLPAVLWGGGGLLVL